ncbi:hypothetical protein L3X38_011995 [Prunus dulcis]|uniref:Uncharacterized protein n=1 Tax=Prunus dulcis TaxID=3755 RepID=A0AAD4WIG2_PRUDU|nr:hypothetical protein L3X38_011995 [Prunus dulcis]
MPSLQGSKAKGSSREENRNCHNSPSLLEWTLNGRLHLRQLLQQKHPSATHGEIHELNLFAERQNRSRTIHSLRMPEPCRTTDALPKPRSTHKIPSGQPCRTARESTKFSSKLPLPNGGLIPAPLEFSTPLPNGKGYTIGEDTLTEPEKTLANNFFNHPCRMARAAQQEESSPKPLECPLPIGTSLNYENLRQLSSCRLAQTRS